jgi:hypothetical protein
MASNTDWPGAFENQSAYTFSANRTAMMMNWGFSFDFAFNTWTLGTSAGYMIPIGNGDWQLAGETFENGPKTFLSGFYFNVNLGYTELLLLSNMIN